MNEREPTALETVWARHGRVDGEPKQGLSRARIVEAGIAIADAEGLGAVSMSRVAGALGFSTMALYRHVGSKEELVLHMQDAAVGEPAVRDGVIGGGWRAGLEGWAWMSVAAFRAHPWLVQTITMFGAPATPNQLAALELGLRALGDAPLSEPEKMSTILLLSAHVFSDLQFAAASTPTAVDAVGEEPYGTLIARVLDPQRFPALLRAVRGGAFEPGEDPAADRDADFAFGLARILDGVERLIECRTR